MKKAEVSGDTAKRILQSFSCSTEAILCSKANNNNEWALAMLEGTHYCLSYVCVPWVYDTVPSIDCNRVNVHDSCGLPA